jgi:hypothetical protein
VIVCQPAARWRGWGTRRPRGPPSVRRWRTPIREHSSEARPQSPCRHSARAASISRANHRRGSYFLTLVARTGRELPDSQPARSCSAPTISSGRGCPFECSFCTIINVQGRRSRCRTTDDIEKVLRGNPSPGVKRFFITDDNFARNKNWEATFDRVIKLKKEEGLEFKFIIQVDALSHLIPNFVEKAGLAGVNRVFIGLESVNPDNLMAAKKSQNKIAEYRTTLQAWKNVGVVTCCGYIIGFPGDTPERVMRDIEIIKRELPVDLIEFFCLTPLPGSEDHRSLSATGAWMDPDLNHYDVEHVTTEHPLMAREDFYNTYRRAWDAYYTPEHVETVMRRAVACGIKASKLQKLLFLVSGVPIHRGRASSPGRVVSPPIPQGPPPGPARRKSACVLQQIFVGDYLQTRPTVETPVQIQAYPVACGE